MTVGTTLERRDYGVTGFAYQETSFEEGSGHAAGMLPIKCFVIVRTAYVHVLCVCVDFLGCGIMMGILLLCQIKRGDFMETFTVIGATI